MAIRFDLDVLRADFKKAAGDKKITRTEVQRIIRRTRRGQLHDAKQEGSHGREGVDRDRGSCIE